MSLTKAPHGRSGPSSNALLHHCLVFCLVNPPPCVFNVWSPQVHTTEENKKQTMACKQNQSRKTESEKILKWKADIKYLFHCTPQPMCGYLLSERDLLFKGEIGYGWKWNNCFLFAWGCVSSTRVLSLRFSLFLPDCPHIMFKHTKRIVLVLDADWTIHIIVILNSIASIVVEGNIDYKLHYIYIHIH